MTLLRKLNNPLIDLLVELKPLTNIQVDKQKRELSKVLYQQDQGVETTIVVMSSISIDPEDSENILGIAYYEMRALWEIFKALKPNINVIYLSSLPISNESIEHLLEIANVSWEQIKSRVNFINLHNSDPHKSLSDKLINCEKVIMQVKEMIKNKNCYLIPFNTTDKEEYICKKLGLAMWGLHPKLTYLATKSGNKKVFKQAGVNFCEGICDIKSVKTLERKLKQLSSDYPMQYKFMLKLNNGVSGEGNALIELPKCYNEYNQLTPLEQKSLILKSIKSMHFFAPKMNFKKFEERLVHGSILELFIEGENMISPSCQGIIHPNGEVIILSTHEQVMNQSGQTFLGSKFPANNVYRQKLTKETKKIGKVLAEKGVIGPFGVDFLLVDNEERVNLYAIEINIRAGGTTHPYFLTKKITKATYDEDKAILKTKDGREIYYQSNDNVISDKLKSRSSKQFLNYMHERKLIYSDIDKNGVAFHLLDAIYPFGKVGFTAISTSRQGVQDLFKKTMSAIQEFENT